VALRVPWGYRVTAGFSAAWIHLVRRPNPLAAWCSNVFEKVPSRERACADSGGEFLQRLEE
jgi:hypothetical protein